MATFSSKGGTTPTTQTTTAQLSPEQSQLMGLVMPKLAQFAAFTPQRYQGSTIAGFDPYQMMAQKLGLQAAGNQNQLAQSSAQTMQNLLAGGGQVTPPGPRNDFRDTRAPEERAANAGGVVGDFIDTRPPEERQVPSPVTSPEAYNSSNVFDFSFPSAPTIPNYAPMQHPDVPAYNAPSAPFGDNFWEPQNNQILRGAIDASTRPIVDTLQRQILPGIRGEAVTTGNFGSSRQGIAEGLASGEASKAIGDTASKLAQSTYGTNVDALGKQFGIQSQNALDKYKADLASGTSMYGTDVGSNMDYLKSVIGAGTSRYGTDVGAATDIFKTNTNAGLTANDQSIRAQLGALGMLPTVSSSFLDPARTIGAVGDTRQQMSQAYINEAMNNWNYDQMAPFLSSKEIMAMIAGMPGGSNTTVASGPQTNPWMVALGGAATGASMGSMFGPWGAGIGGLGGGLIGLLGSK